MKKGKILIYGLLLFLGVTACENDDSSEIFWPARADFNYSPSAPLAGDEIVFDAEPRPGSGEITSWSWNFGDENSTTSTVMDPTFVFENSGTYEVVLTINDASQNEYQVTKTVTVLPQPTDVFESRIVWDFTTGSEISGINDGSSSPVIGDDGTIYYTQSRAGLESKIVAVKDNGETAELKWLSSYMGGDIPNAPSIGPDGNIFINAWVDEQAISKIDATDGSIMWSGGIGTDVSNNTAAVDSEGNTYHGSRSQGANGGVFSWSPT
ncbi:PKD domain-containing protein [Antarcticibacterium sp. 1MA-6-2]|uniref:PKD domain-containing protein n=1 Tax=Antarcticibacterium sp. 1MA-6-2 TaxID=2908210 RepID=UPI001F1CC373|nr:PKD domain-containing protein [Antarcticibacterium sp. 1MA-6-2]UJH90157.1 PKD domain-containing protein [Antarcticibacterium sp. 1MA-6-2]